MSNIIETMALRVPADFPVRPEPQGAHTTTCNACHLSWDDSIVTGYTPAPAGRCPFEAYHP